MTEAAPALEARGVRKSYGGHPALVGVDVTVEPGEIVGLLGPNGAGKTTLVSIVAGLRRPDAGTVAVCGVDVVRHPDRARERLGLAPQELGIYPMLRVRENLSVFGELAGLRRRGLAERIDEVAAALGLTELLDRVAAHLSGGEKRRLHTAMALLHRPALCMLDEPTTGADVASRTQLLALVRRLAEEGAAVVYSTHYLPEVESLGASVLLVDRGRVIARGSVAELVAAHARSTVELAFDGPAPALAVDGALPPEGAVVRVSTDAPARAAVEALQSLGDDTTRLRGIEIVRPSLETVFLALTGRRYDADGEGGPADGAPAEGEGRDVVLT